jgi:large conductance mechanosensitive channel
LQPDFQNNEQHTAQSGVLPQLNIITMGMLQEFKQFAMRGNVVDMAVGVIIGGAFGKIVTSVVSDIIMPPIGCLVGGANFTDLKIVLKDAVMEGEEIVTPAVTLNYGNFIQVVIDFLIVAFAVFMLIKGINALSRKKKEEPAAPAAPPEPSAEEKLLSEIRDLLKEKK